MGIHIRRLSSFTTLVFAFVSCSQVQDDQGRAQLALPVPRNNAENHIVSNVRSASVRVRRTFVQNPSGQVTLVWSSAPTADPAKSLPLPPTHHRSGETQETETLGKFVAKLDADTSSAPAVALAREDAPAPRARFAEPNEQAPQASGLSQLTFDRKHSAGDDALDHETKSPAENGKTPVEGRLSRTPAELPHPREVGKILPIFAVGAIVFVVLIVLIAYQLSSALQHTTPSTKRSTKGDFDDAD